MRPPASSGSSPPNPRKNWRRSCTNIHRQSKARAALPASRVSGTSSSRRSRRGRLSWNSSIAALGKAAGPLPEASTFMLPSGPLRSSSTTPRKTEAASRTRTGACLRRSRAAAGRLRASKRWSGWSRNHRQDSCRSGNRRASYSNLSVPNWRSTNSGR